MNELVAVLSATGFIAGLFLVAGLIDLIVDYIQYALDFRSGD